MSIALESKVRELERTVKALEARLDHIERRAAPSVPPAFVKQPVLDVKGKWKNENSARS